MADSYRELARELMGASTPTESSLEALIGGLKATSKRLHEELAPVVGSLGLRLIMERAVRIATSRHPFLRRVAVYEDGIDAGGVLGEKSDRDYQAVREGFEDLLAGFLELLGELVGRDLAFTLVDEAASPKGEDEK